MRVLHVVQRYWPYIGGSERYFQEVSERLAAEGHQVTVVTTNAWDLEYFWNPRCKALPCGKDVHNGVEIIRLPLRHLPFSSLSYRGAKGLMSLLSRLPGRTRGLLSLLSRATPPIGRLEALLSDLGETYDIVHAANITFESLIQGAHRFAQGRGIPFVLTPFVHLGEDGSDAVRKYYTMRHQIRMMAESQRVIVQTDREKDYLIAKGVPRERLVKIGVGVNPGEVQGGSGPRFRRQHGISAPIVFSIGAQAYDKGSFHLVEAMKRLWRAGQEAELVLAGPVLKPFAAFIAAQPPEVRRRCHVLGFVSEETKRDLLAAGDVFAMPSRTDSFGIVYLEAWANGKPVVGALAGGVPEVIRDSIDGYLVPFGDVERLAQAIALLLANTDLARQLGNRGRQRVLAEHTWDTKYRLVRALYEEVTGKAIPSAEPQVTASAV